MVSLDALPLHLRIKQDTLPPLLLLWREKGAWLLESSNDDIPAFGGLLAYSSWPNTGAMEIIQPAQLAFLAIYNPSLGRTDETVSDQVVYYYSAPAETLRRHGQSPEAVERAAREERNERLRQIGLAQGMVEFAKAFSEGAPVESIDAEKSRIVLHQLEPGWWLLASVDLTRLRNAPGHSRSKSEEATEEYSAREVAPQELILCQLLRAHSEFLLHHAPSLADLYVRLSREKFCGILEIFWNRFLASWDVLLHGNPTVDIFHGVKLAAGGELGVGVGEEEWGSGERAVLEGFVGHTEGLVDIMVARFGDEEGQSGVPWLGRGICPNINDGIVFSGVGALTRQTLRAISTWLQSVYVEGVAAYGIMENPQSMRRRRRKKQTSQTTRKHDVIPSERRGRASNSRIASPVTSPDIPPPIVRAADEALATATNELEQREQHHPEHAKHPNLSKKSTSDTSTTDTWVKYMTLGVYGSTWGIPAGRARSPSQGKASDEELKAGKTKGSTIEATISSKPASPTKTRHLRTIAPQSTEGSDPNTGYDLERGCFLIGLRGDLNTSSSTNEPETLSDSGRQEDEDNDWNQRIVVRTLHLELPMPEKSLSEDTLTTAIPTHETDTYFDRFRVVLYARRPFLYAFIFSVSTPSLSYADLYHGLHQQLAPLHKPLIRSTSPSQAQARAADLRTPRTAATPPRDTSDSPVWDIVYDPTTLNIAASLPNIPEPKAAAGLTGIGGKGRMGSPSPTHSASQDWSRLEALHIHSQVLATFSATRHRIWERERVLKTARGWWLVWLRVIEEKSSSETTDSRKASRTGDSAELAASNAEGSAKRDADGLPDHSISGSPPAPSSSDDHEEPPTKCEAILIRHAPDAVGGASGTLATKKSSGWGSVAAVFTGGSPLTSPQRAGSSSGTTPGKEGEGVNRMVEGVGLDARRYVEGLLKVRR